MALIPLLKSCNQRCLFCSAYGRDDKFTLAGINKFIDAEAARGAGAVTLSGGETTFFPRLPEVVARARAKGLRVELQTNGLTSAYPENAARLASLGVDLFNVNFPSHDEAVNDRLTGTSGTLGPRIRGVRNLLAAGARVRLTHLVTELNYKALPEFVRFVRRELPGVAYIQFSYVKILGLAGKNAWLAPGYAQAAPWLVQALQACRRGRLKAMVDHIPPCWLGRFAPLSVDYIKLAGAGDLSAALTEKKKLPACARCALGDRCLGPRADHARLFGRAAVRPVLKKPVRRAKPKNARR